MGAGTVGWTITGLTAGIAAAGCGFRNRRYAAAVWFLHLRLIHSEINTASGSNDSTPAAIAIRDDLIRSARLLISIRITFIQNAQSPGRLCADIAA